MAASRGVPVLLLAILVVAVTAAADDTTHLHFFMHETVSGSNPTSVQVMKGPGGGSASFGDTSVMDDPLTETSSPASAPVGRMQGVRVLSSQSGAAAVTVTANILLTTGDRNGSTLAVMGRRSDDDADGVVSELSVVGGTGGFRMATGYVLWKTVAASGPDATVELDVYLAVDANGTATVDDAPVSPASSSSSSAGSGGSRPSSGTATGSGRMTGWWTWVVGVGVAAVVGCCGVW